MSEPTVQDRERAEALLGEMHFCDDHCDTDYQYEHQRERVSLLASALAQDREEAEIRGALSPEGWVKRMHDAEAAVARDREEIERLTKERDEARKSHHAMIDHGDVAFEELQEATERIRTLEAEREAAVTDYCAQIGRILDCQGGECGRVDGERGDCRACLLRRLRGARAEREAAVQAERERCCAAVCQYCAAGFPALPEPTFDAGWSHTVTVETTRKGSGGHGMAWYKRDGVEMYRYAPCGAAAIRASREPAPPAPERSQEWWIKKAAAEEGHTVLAGGEPAPPPSHSSEPSARQPEGPEPEAETDGSLPREGGIQDLDGTISPAPPASFRDVLRKHGMEGAPNNRAAVEAAAPPASMTTSECVAAGWHVCPETGKREPGHHVCARDDKPASVTTEEK